MDTTSPITFKDEECGDGTRVLRMMQGDRIVGVCGWYENDHERELLRRGALVGFVVANDCLKVRKAELR